MVILRKEETSIILKNLGCICEYADNFVSCCDIFPEDHCDFGMLPSTLLYARALMVITVTNFLPLLTLVIPVLKPMQGAEMCM